MKIWIRVKVHCTLQRAISWSASSIDSSDALDQSHFNTPLKKSFFFIFLFHHFFQVTHFYFPLKSIWDFVSDAFLVFLLINIFFLLSVLLHFFPRMLSITQLIWLILWVVGNMKGHLQYLFIPVKHRLEWWEWTHRTHCVC